MALPTGRGSLHREAWRRVARSAVRVRSRGRGLLASTERGSAAAPTWAPKTPTVNVLGAQGRDRYGDWPPATATVPAGGARGRSAPARTHLGRIGGYMRHLYRPSRVRLRPRHSCRLPLPRCPNHTPHTGNARAERSHNSAKTGQG